MVDVVIVGGGISALACGVALADAGLQVTVFERSAELGGRARSWLDEKTGDAVDIGPHVLHSEYANMLAFLDRLGTRELVTWQPKKVLTIASKPHPVVLRHRPLPAPLSLIPSLLTAPGLGMKDYLSMLRVTWRTMKFGEEEVLELDRVSALDFFRSQGVSEAMIRWWWAFAAMVVCNVPIERCSAAYLMRIHAQLSGHRGVHFGFGGVGLSELYVPQATRIIEKAGGQVLTGLEVQGFIGEQTVEGVILADGTRLYARQCISALPPQELARIIPARWKSMAPFNALESFEGSPYISTYLWFDRTITGERFFTHLWSPERLNYDFYDLSKIRRGWESRPSIITSNIIYSHRAHGMSDAAIIDATLADIAEFAPAVRQARLVHARVHRIPMAIPCPTPGTEAKRPAAKTPIPGLTLAGDWLQTHLPCSMESAVRSGAMAAEQVMAAFGAPCKLALPQRQYDDLVGVVRAATRKLRRHPGEPGPVGAAVQDAS